MVAHKQLDNDDDIHVYQEPAWTAKHGMVQGIWLAVNRGYVMDNPHEDFIGVALTQEQVQNLREWLNQLEEKTSPAP